MNDRILKYALSCDRSSIFVLYNNRQLSIVPNEGNTYKKIENEFINVHDQIVQNEEILIDSFKNNQTNFLIDKIILGGGLFETGLSFVSNTNNFNVLAFVCGLSLLAYGNYHSKKTIYMHEVLADLTEFISKYKLYKSNKELMDNTMFIIGNNKNTKGVLVTERPMNISDINNYNLNELYDRVDDAKRLVKINRR